MTDTIKVALCTSSYAPNQDTHTFFSDVTNELSTAGGYTAGGQALGTKSVSYDSASNETRLIAADPSWTSATFACQYAVIYKDTGAAGTSPLLGYVDLGAQSVTAGTFTLDLDQTAGALKITAA